MTDRRLSPAHRIRARRPHRGAVVFTPYEQPPVKASKALAAAVVTVLGLVGVTLSDGATQLVAAVVQLLLVTFAVWRTVNRPKGPRP